MGKKKKKASEPAAQCIVPRPKTGRVIEVKHPVHGTYTAKEVKDRLQAVQAAAKAWGGLQWSKIARECEFREVQADDLDGTE